MQHLQKSSQPFFFVWNLTRHDRSKSLESKTDETNRGDLVSCSILPSVVTWKCVERFFASFLHLLLLVFTISSDGSNLPPTSLFLVPFLWDSAEWGPTTVFLDASHLHEGQSKLRMTRPVHGSAITQPSIEVVSVDWPWRSPEPYARLLVFYWSERIFLGKSSILEFPSWWNL